MKIFRVQLLIKKKLPDVLAKVLEENARRFYQIETGNIRSSKVFTICSSKPAPEIRDFAEFTLLDPLLHDLYIDELYTDPAYSCSFSLAKLPGVTDDEGSSVQKSYADYFNIPMPSGEIFIYSSELYYIEKALRDEEVRILAYELLGNPLTHHLEYPLSP